MHQRALARPCPLLTNGLRWTWPGSWLGTVPGVVLGVSLLGGCSGGSSDAADLSVRDLRAADLRPADLQAPSDLRGDMTPPPDLAPPMVTGLPTDCVAGTTVDVVYSTVIAPRCGSENCHGQTSMRWGALSAAQFKSTMVNQRDTQSADMVRVKPSDLNGSYLMYKLTNQQTKVVPEFRAGAQMPNGGNPLDHDSLCKVISWIQGGAN